MRPSAAWGFATALTCFTGHAAAVGYFIDPVSCDAAMQAAVQNVIDGAFDMVQAGFDNADAADANRNGPEQALLDNLFGPEAPGTSPAISIKTIIRSRFGTSGLLQLRGNKFRSNEDLQPGFRTNNVKIYCDERRLQIRKKNPLKSYDNDVGEVKPTGECNINVAWSGQTQNSFAQVQLCPKLMKRILVDDFKTTAAFQPNFWAKMVASALQIVGKIGYSPIDILQLGDKVLLHELTHLNIGGNTDDVGGFFNAYGWSNCRRLSTVTENRATAGAQANADTWALYGSVSLLIKKDKKTVDRDSGMVVVIPRAAKERALEAVRTLGGFWKKFVA